MFQLRHYQTRLVESIRGAMLRSRRVLAVSPTGSGKTVTFAHISHRAGKLGKRIIITAHRAEIAEQISGALDEMDVAHGFVAPGRTYSPIANVQVAMIQTLSRRLGRIRPPNVLIVDEAHHSIAASWERVATAWDVPIVGFTATPQRMDGRGLGKVFDEIVQGPTVRELIEEGYLADYELLAPPDVKDIAKLSEIRKRAGDYAKGELDTFMRSNTLYGNVIEHYREFLNGRPAIAFCVSVGHSELTAEAFRRQGWRAAAIHGGLSPVERKQMVADFSAGKLNVLTSCELISEGFDVPGAYGALLMRPTQSLALYLQQVGRALRPKSDGGQAIVLDHVNNVSKHGFPCQDREWTLADTKQANDAPSVHTCAVCFRVMPPELRAALRRERRCLGDKTDALECPALQPEAPGTREREIEVVDGVKLQRRKKDGRPEPDETLDPCPEWADGINVREAEGWRYGHLMRLAGQDRERLHYIARVRGYKPGWVHVQLKRQQEREQGPRMFG